MYLFLYFTISQEPLYKIVFDYSLITMDDKQLVGRPQLHRTDEEKEELREQRNANRRKPSQQHLKVGRPQKYKTIEERLEAERKQKAEHRQKKKCLLQVCIFLLYNN